MDVGSACLYESRCRPVVACAGALLLLLILTAPAVAHSDAESPPEIAWKQKAADRAIEAIAFSPDGSQIAVTRDRLVALRCVTDGSLLGSLEGHKLDVTSVAFSSDGALIATADRGGTVKLWCASRRVLKRTLEGGTGAADCVAFSPDSSLLAVGTWGAVTLWCPAEGTEVMRLKGYDATVESVAFSPDGVLLATGCSDRVVRVWRIGDATLVRTLGGHSDGIESVAFTPDGRHLVVGGDLGEENVWLWSVADWSVSRKLRAGYRNSKSLSISHDGRLLATAGHDAMLWRLSDGTLLRRLGRVVGASLAAFSPKGDLLVTANWHGYVTLWHVPDEGFLLPLVGHDNDVSGLAFSPDGSLLASCAWDAKVNLWRVKDGSFVRTLEGHKDFVCSVAFSPDSTLLASGGTDGTLRLWRISDGALLRTIGEADATVRSVAFCPDGKTIATGGWLSGEGIKGYRVVKLYRVADGVCELSLRVPSYEAVVSVAFSPDGKLLAVAFGGTVELRSSSDGTLVRTIYTFYDVESLAFSTTGVLAAGTRGGTVWIWEPSDGSVVTKLEAKGGQIAFSPGGRLLVTAGELTPMARVWRVPAGLLVLSLTGHKEGIRAVAFSSDGSLIATGGAEAEIRLWRVPKSVRGSE